MKAVILAGGKGARLAPYTTVFPKPMLPVGEKPILEIIIRQLAHYGFDDITISVGYLAEIIEAYFQRDHSIPRGVDLKYVRESRPLGTAGAIGLLGDVDDTFLVMNGDVLTTMDYLRLMAFHKENEAVLTIALAKKDVPIDLGVVELDGGYRVKRYIEKPVYSFLDSMGIYIYEPEVIRYIKPDGYLDFPTLATRLIEDGKKVIGYQTSHACYWIDMGRHGDYEKAVQEFSLRRKEFLPDESIAGS
jgi:NDP-sugar pyrophosphorylase family protein